MAEKEGLYAKYDVRRLNDDEGKHINCMYFILDLDHDEHAAGALLAYANLVESDNPTLAVQLREVIYGESND